MEIINAAYSYKIYSNLLELDEKDKALMEAAILQIENAYAPYSNFQVGAAVRLTDGDIFYGCNQENASYPLCMCGERVALYNAGAYRPHIPVDSLAISIRNLKMKIELPVSPCGACRQVISEFEFRHKHKIRILLKSDSDQIYEISTVADLLPLGFNGSFL